MISYGADRPTSGITRYTQEVVAALQKGGIPLTVMHTAPARIEDGSLRLRGAARVPGLLTLGQLEIAWNARRRRLALVHDPTGLVPLFVTGGRRVATIHDMIPSLYPENSTFVNRLVARFWLPIAARRLHGIITVSYQSKADIVCVLHVEPERVAVVPNGVDARYQPIDREQAGPVLERYGIRFPYILYVSAVEPRKKRKNLPRLLEAYTRLRQWSEDWRLVIAGSVRRDYRPVFDMLEQLKLEAHVHFTGFVAEPDLPALYSGADLFVLPSLYEGFGLPVLEAMACGVPVITSNISSLPEVAGDAAILVDPCSVDEIASALQGVLSNPELAAELRTKGLARARQFTWERTARETIAVYERVLGVQIHQAVSASIDDEPAPMASRAQQIAGGTE